MPASFHRLSSAIWVPERSPREMKGAAFALMVCSAVTMTDQHEVIVHNRIALQAKTFGEKFLLGRLGMHEHHIGIAAPGGVERLAGALRHHLHVDAGLFLEDRQQIAEQAGILRRGRRSDNDRFFLSCVGPSIHGNDPFLWHEKPQHGFFHRPTKARPTRKLSALTAIDRTIRMTPKARAKLKSPLLVSSAIAVVMVRV